MARVTLTDRFVSSAKANGSDRTEYFDAKSPGLCLRVSEGGHKTWAFIFTSPKSSKRARMKLGVYPGSSLADARTRALEARGYLDEGRDPRDVLAGSPDMTVTDLVTAYLEQHARPALRSAASIERRLHKNVTPLLGTMRLADLHRRDVTRIVDPVLKRGKRTEAARIFEDTRAMLRWGVACGYFDSNPMEGMKKPDTPDPRERFLTDEEIAAIWNGLPEALPRSKACQRIIRLCLLTAQRVGEVSGMRRDELDLDGKLWSLPGSRTKNGRAHAVPLSDLAVSTIEDALSDAGDVYLFPNAEGDGPLPPHAVARTIGRAHETSEDRPKGRFGIEHWTAHDLRRTAITGMAKLGVAPLVLGHVINHRSVTKAGVTLAVYAHYDHAKEKREALDLWADRLAAIIAGGA